MSLEKSIAMDRHYRSRFVSLGELDEDVVSFLLGLVHAKDHLVRVAVVRNQEKVNSYSFRS